ncbi:MAG: Asp-tRNA(Asn)/Glu-tRNA(Gln) amidotransferase subunit GatA [Ferruginibacter sp.]
MFNYQTITAYHQQLRLGETTCRDVVQFYVEKIEANNKLNAFVQVYKDEAFLKAEDLDNKRKSGCALKKLHGVVIAIKDVICYKGHSITAASAILKDYIPLYNATAVQLLLDEDAIIIGTCNCDEFAMGSTNEHSVYGKVLNGISNNHVPGGSSGGSAVAVQMDMCMLSLGSDTGGSVRQPADFCGVIGFKPGYGAISRYGLIAYASSFDQIGIFGKNIPDVGLLLEVMSAPDEFDSTMNISLPPVLFIKNNTSDEKTRFCYFTEMMDHPSLDKEIAQALFQTFEELKKAGHAVEPVDLKLVDYIVPAYYVLTTAEASSNLARYDGVRYGHRTQQALKDLTTFYLQNRSEGFGTEVKKRIMLGTFVLSTGYYDAYFNKALQVRKMLVEHMAMVFNKFDVLILPNSPSTAFRIGDNDKDPIAVYLADIFTVFANLTGTPAISLPLYKHSNGLPFGIQLMTNRGDELTLLQISDELMKNSHHPDPVK